MTVPSALVEEARAFIARDGGPPWEEWLHGTFDGRPMWQIAIEEREEFIRRLADEAEAYQRTNLFLQDDGFRARMTDAQAQHAEGVELGMAIMAQKMEAFIRTARPDRLQRNSADDA